MRTRIFPTTGSALIVISLLAITVGVYFPNWCGYQALQLSDELRADLIALRKLSRAQTALLLADAIEEGTEPERILTRILLPPTTELRSRAERLYRQQTQWWPRGDAAAQVDPFSRIRANEYPTRFIYEQALYRLLILLGEQQTLGGVWLDHWTETLQPPLLRSIGFGYGMSEIQPSYPDSRSAYLDNWSQSRLDARLIEKRVTDTARLPHTALTQLIIARLALILAVVSGALYLLCNFFISRNSDTERLSGRSWGLRCYLAVWLTLNVSWFIQEQFGEYNWHVLSQWAPYALAVGVLVVVAVKSGVNTTDAWNVFHSQHSARPLYLLGACGLAISLSIAGSLTLSGVADYCGDSFPLFGILGPDWKMNRSWPDPWMIGNVVLEEVCFRGLLFSGLMLRVGLVPAVVISSLIFAIGHPPTIWTFLSAGWDGIVYSSVYYRTRSLLPLIAAHLFFNALVA